MTLISVLIVISFLLFVDKVQVRVVFDSIVQFIKTRKLVQSIDCTDLRVIDLLRSKLLLIHNRLGYVFKRLGGQRSNNLRLVDHIDLDFWENDLKVGDFESESS